MEGCETWDGVIECLPSVHAGSTGSHAERALGRLVVMVVVALTMELVGGQPGIGRNKHTAGSRSPGVCGTVLKLLSLVCLSPCPPGALTPSLFQL